MSSNDSSSTSIRTGIARWKGVLAHVPARYIPAVLAIPLTLSLTVGALTYWTVQRRTQSAALTAQTYQVLLALRESEIELVSGVSAFRLFVLSPGNRTKQSYLAAFQEFDRGLAQARDLALDNPSQTERLDRIRTLADRWRTSADLAIQDRRSNAVQGIVTARRTLDERSVLIQSARKVFADCVQEELRLLDVREKDERATEGSFAAAVFGVLVLAFALGSAAVIMVVGLEGSSRALADEMDGRMRAQSRTDALVERSPHPMVISDRQGRIVQVNSEALHVFGYSREEMIGQTVELLVPLRLRGTHPELRDGYMRNPVTRPMGTGRELFAVRKDGSEFPVDISLAPIESEDGLQVIASVVDITEHIRTQEALVEANRAFQVVNRELDSFAYSVAHDLRAPLRSVTGFAELLLNRHSEGMKPEALDFLARIHRAGVRMAQLIDDLLTLSRIARAELRREPVSLSDVALGILGDLRASEPERTIQWVVQEGLNDEADPRLLRVLLDNLLGNAWKFTSRVDSARIEFGTVATDSGLAYFVRDNGAGFDMAYADKLFKPFERLHDMKEFSGTGVGLATAHRIVSRHGGRIWAESALGQGATFYFTL